jgi:O-antigen/teichoic acid export membrane protein
MTANPTTGGDLKKKTISGVIWSFLEQVLARGINFVIGIILARLLTPDDYGLVGMLGIFIGLSNVFIDGGFASALIQCKNRTEEDLSTVQIINVGMSIIIYAILFICAPFIARFYDQPLLTSITRILSLSLIIGALSSVSGTLLSIRIDFKTKAYISIIKSVLTGAVAIACAYCGMGVWALVVQGLTAAALSTLITIAFVRWFPKTGFSGQSFRKLFSYGSKLLAATLISNIYDNIYSLVIGKTVSPAAVGQYSRAGHFPQLGNGVVSGMINRVAFPVLSRIQDDDQRLLRVYEKYIQISCFLIFPILMGLCGCSRPIILLLLTDKWAACIPLMRILCLATLLAGVTTINLNLLYVKGRSDLVLKLEVIKKIIAFSIVFATAFFSVTVMCWGQVIYSVIAFVLNTVYTKKILGYGLFSQLKTILPYLLIAAVIGLEALTICHFISNDWWALSLSVGVCGLTYIGIHALARTYAIGEARQYLSNLFRRGNV